MKKIVFNGISLINKEVYGVQRFTIELLKELDNLIEPEEIEVVIPSNLDIYNRLRFKNIIVKEVFIPKVKVMKWLWNQFGFVLYAKRKNAITVDLSLDLPLIGCDIVCIHDCIRELYKEAANSFLDKLSLRFYILKVKRNIKKAKYLLTVSECSKNDIKKMYKDANNKPFEIISNAWQHFNFIEPDYSIFDILKIYNKEYFFALGSRNIHKNFKWIIEAAKQNRNYLFVISGTNTLSKSDSFLNKEAPQNLLFTGYLSDAKIKALMEKCKAFIQPSLYEGFGIPPMEAMSCGARCIVSNTSSLPEIYGESVWYINPYVYNNISLNQIMSMPIKPNSYVLESFSWKNSAKKLYKVLESL